MLINLPKICSYFKKSATTKVVKNIRVPIDLADSKLAPLASDVINFQKTAKKSLGSFVELESGTLKLISDEKDLGAIVLCKKDYQYTRKGYPNYYNNLSGTLTKPSLEINILRSHQKGLGVGTKLVQEAVKKSLELGFEGRVLITACSIDGKTSPLAFYYKLGFKSIDNKTNKLIESCIKKNKKVPKDTTSFMYLPKENVATLLAK